MPNVLNDPQAIYQIDSLKILASLRDLPNQCGEAWEMGMTVPLPAETKPKSIIVTGLGGSAIGGDLLRVYTAGRTAMPVIVNRDYSLPAFIDQQTLVFVVSYSGNTEETLSAYEQARARKAKILVLTTGGKLKAMAENDHVPVVAVPGGIAPRSATGYLFIPMLAVLERLGLVSGVKKEVDELVLRLQLLREELKPEVNIEGNLSKQLAARFYGHIPVIWGASTTTEVVAQRWKGQLNENTKTPAYWNVFPELNHNEIVGFEKPEELLQKLYIVMLQDKDDHPQVQKRMEITREVVKKVVAGVEQVHSTGSGALARIYSLIYTGDYASIYLAVLYGIDPGPVKVIDGLKEKLAQSG